MIKSLIIFFGQNSFGRFPYYLAAKFLSTRHRCWPRHSYVFNDLVPGLSDLDMTVLYDEAPTRFEVETNLSTSRYWKKSIFPFMGEVNIYSRAEVNDFIPFANPLEVKRDPFLLSELKYESSLPSLEEISIFLLRGLEADAKNLTSHSTLRQKKWNRFFLLSGLPPPSQTDLNFLLSKILDLMPFTVKKLEAEILSHLKGEITTCSFDVQVLFSHRYLSNVVEKLDSMHPLQRFAQLQIEWEIWGLYGQCRQLAVLPKTHNFWWSQHIEMCQRLESKMNWNFSGSFKKLNAIFENLQSQ